MPQPPSEPPIGTQALRFGPHRAGIGLLGTALVWSLALAEHGDAVGLTALITIHQEHPGVLYATLSPIAWGLFGLWLGRAADAAVDVRADLQKVEASCATAGGERGV